MAEDILEASFKQQMADYQKKIKEYEIKVGEYKTQLRHIIEKSGELFEKQLIYVAAGTIAGSVYIIDKFLEGTQDRFYFVLLCWGLCGATILVNLCSHYAAIKLYKKTENELSSDNFDNKKADKRARIIEWFNIVSLILYFGGLICLIVFILINMDKFNRP